MTGKFTVEIISPERIILKNEADEVVIPSFEGEMGILKDHLPLITFLRPGLIKIKEDDLTKVFFIEEGTIEFSENKLLILTSSAKETSKMNKNCIDTLISDAENNIKSDNISDKEKYLLSHKIESLKNINQ